MKQVRVEAEHTAEQKEKHMQRRMRNSTIQTQRGERRRGGGVQTEAEEPGAGQTGRAL